MKLKIFTLRLNPATGSFGLFFGTSYFCFSCPDGPGGYPIWDVKSNDGMGAVGMKKRIFGIVGFQVLTLGLFSVVALGQTGSAEKDKSQSFEDVVSDASKGLKTGSWVALGNVSHIMGNNVSVTGYQVASPAEQANAPYGDKGVEIQTEISA